MRTQESITSMLNVKRILCTIIRDLQQGTLPVMKSIGVSLNPYFCSYPGYLRVKIAMLWQPNHSIGRPNMIKSSYDERTSSFIT